MVYQHDCSTLGILVLECTDISGVIATADAGDGGGMYNM